MLVKIKSYPSKDFPVRIEWTKNKIQFSLAFEREADAKAYIESYYPYERIQYKRERG